MARKSTKKRRGVRLIAGSLSSRPITRIMSRSGKRKLGGTALKNRAYKLLKTGRYKITSATGWGKRPNTRYRGKWRKDVPGIYIYELR